MAISTVGDLARILRQLRLLEPAQLDELDGPLVKQFGDPKALARELVKRGWLTPFQVNQIFTGHAAELVLGSYILLDRLGEGGMGEVFKARNWKLGRVVALKLVRKERVSRPETIRRFQREIRAAAKLIHPNVVHAHDADEVNGTHFLLMDFVEGIDLARHVKQSGPLPIPLACEYIRQAALGLQHAHEHGMVHRDIKPHNLLLSVVRGSKSDGQKSGDARHVVKILDMGLARLQQAEDGDQSSTSLTQEGLVLGTVDYVAPEQAINAHGADIRADIYSLGCTLYFLLTGQVPFPGGTATEKLIRHQCDQCVPVESLRPDVSPGLAALLRRVMAKRREDRPQTPAELADALQTLLDGGELADAPASRPAMPGPDEASAFAALDTSGTVTISSDSSLSSRRSRSSPGKALWIGGATLAAFLVIIVVIWMNARETRPVKPGPEKSVPVTLAYQVEAGRRWQDTGIDVKAGAALAITFKGKWQLKSGLEAAAAGDEKAPRVRAVASEAPILCLLARLGDSAEMIPLGMEKEWRPAADGRLFVQPNYLDLDELSGNIRMEIKGASAGKNSFPRPAPVRIQSAEAELRTLQARMLHRKEDAEVLRRDLLEFTSRYSDTTQSMVAAELLMPLAAPLDGLAPTGSIDAAQAPPGLVTVFGGDDGKPISVLSRSRDDLRLATLTSGGAARIWDVLAAKPIVGPWDKSSVRALAMSPDGKTLAVVTGSDSVKEWDIDSGKLRSSQSQDAAVHCLDYSGDGDRLAAGFDDGAVVVWKSGTQTELFRDRLAKTAIICVRFRADGRLASSAANRSMRLWDLAGKSKQVAWNSPELADTLAFRPDGGMLALSGKSLRVFDPATGRGLFTVRNPENGAGDCVAAFRPDGAVLYFADGQGKLFLWDTGKRRQLRRLDMPRRVTCLASSSDGRHLFTGNSDGSVLLLRLGPSEYLSGKSKSPGSNPLDGLQRADISDSELALATDKLTDAPPRELVAVLGQGPLRHGGGINAMTISPDGKYVASAGDDHRVKIWDGATGKLLRECNGHTSSVLSLEYSADGSLLASAGRDNTVRIWNPADGKQREMFRDNLGDVVVLAFDARAARIACGCNNGGIRVFSMRPDKPLPWLTGHAGLIKRLAFSADGASLYSAGIDGRLFDRQLGVNKLDAELQNKGGLGHPCFLPDKGGMIAVDPDGKVIQIAWDGERKLLPLKGSPRATAMAVSSNAKILAVADSDGTIGLHDRITGRRLRLLPNRFPVISLAFSGNGEVLLVETAHGFRVWQLDSWKETVLLIGHHDAVRSLAPTPDGKSLISGGLGGSILLWDLAKATASQGLYHGDGTPLTSLSLAPDGGRLAASSRGRWIKSWTVPAGREIFARRLTVIPNNIAWSPDGQQVVIALENGNLETWDGTSSLLRSSLKTHPTGISRLAFSADGRRLATAGRERAVKLWQWRPFRELTPFYLTHPIDSLAFASDNERLAIGSNEIHIKDTLRNKNVAELEGGTPPIRLAYHPRKAFLASADAAGHLNIWHDTTNVCRWRFSAALHSVAFSADGRYLFAGSASGLIMVFRVPS
ncbi:MAG: hypothetical protein FJ271_06955 [Planctomycetes bacterium]|nr:hypothetical protein [Planctomycetota bacterium]